MSVVAGIHPAEIAPIVIPGQDADFFVKPLGGFDADESSQTAAAKAAHLPPQDAKLAYRRASATGLDGGQSAVIVAPLAVMLDRQQVVSRKRQGVQIRNGGTVPCENHFLSIHKINPPDVAKVAGLSRAQGRDQLDACFLAFPLNDNVNPSLLQRLRADVAEEA